MLLLAATSALERNYNYLADYVKFNRIVLIIFFLGGYLAYNTLDVYAVGNGLGIYGGVFKVTMLSQVFDIILFVIGGLVTILTCFVPYNYIKYNTSKYMEFNIKEDRENSEKFKLEEIFNIKNDFIKKLSIYYTNSDFLKKPKLYKTIFNFFKYLIEKLPNIKLNTPFLVENKLFYPKLEVKEYTLLLLYTVLGGSLLISSQNLISIYLSLELQSFTLYILSTSQIRSFRGTSGGLKYFLLGGLSSGFILFGCSLLYAYTGTLNLEHIFMIYSDSLTNYFIDPCLLILFAGLLFKVSAAPFHQWAPDVYSDVPTYSTTWLIIIAKLSILVLMLILIHNIHASLNLNNLNLIEQNYSLDIQTKDINVINDLVINNNPDLIKEKEDLYNMKVSSLYTNDKIVFSFWNPSYSSLGIWTNLLTLSALFSLVIGTVLGISQSRIKRLFAYSTITHVGFLLLALSLNSIISLDAFIFYLIQYTITNLNLFFILVAWGYLYSRYYLDDDFIPLRFLKINPFSWKDIYIEPSLNDFFESVLDNNYQWNDNNRSHLEKSIRINTIHNYSLIHHEFRYYDFKTEENNWLYTPVPFLTNFKGMHYTDPFLAFCLSVTIFSLTGIPPLIGFFAKQQVLLASMQIDYYFISIIAILTSVIGAAYYLRIIKFIYFYDDVFMPYYISYNYNNHNYKDNNIINNKNRSEFTLNSNDSNKDYLLPMLPSNSLSLIIALLTNISLFYILKPYVLVNIVYMITIPLFQI
jgi:NADH:ubiquinone oxidoreductase subunit 2 (subunit N)